MQEDSLTSRNVDISQFAAVPNVLGKAVPPPPKTPAEHYKDGFRHPITGSVQEQGDKRHTQEKKYIYKRVLQPRGSLGSSATNAYSLTKSRNIYKRGRESSWNEIKPNDVFFFGSKK